MRARRVAGMVALVLCLVAAGWAAAAFVRNEARAAQRVQAFPESTEVSTGSPIVDPTGSITVAGLSTSTAPTTAASTAATSTAASSTTARSTAASSTTARSPAASSTTARSPAASSTTARSPAASSTAASSTTARSPAASSTTASSTAPSRTAITSQAPTVPEPGTSASPDTIAAAVDAAVQQAADDGLVEHVVIEDRNTGSITTAVDADALVPSMSLFKLFIATDVLVRNGGIAGLDVDNQEQLWRMITRSDDGIAQDYYDRDGGEAIVERTIDRYGLTDTEPPAESRYWGDVQVSARDMASFLRQALSAPLTGRWLESAMAASTDTGADGFDQNFGLNAIAGAGSKQGWGCCLSDVMAIHSIGFTADQIVVVLSTSDPDNTSHELGSADQLADDPGAQLAVQAATQIAKAAVYPGQS